jgi:ABC-type multidrug transport system fused ATPase/permease subunit
LIDVTSGGILVDGVNINTIEPETVRERIVGHPQFTFSNGAATVRKNIDPFDSFSDDAIRQALSRVAAGSYMCDDVMSKLENKWDECGFAAGWQQRIGLARTILRQSNVYVLDEPTSGYVLSSNRGVASFTNRHYRMDEESHSLVMEALFDALADRTVLVVTHLLLGIERFDTILVMSDGKLVESGRPSELLLDPSTKLSKFSQAASRGAEK